MCIQPGSAISPATSAYDTKNAPLTSTVRDLEFTISRFESGAQCDKHWLRLGFASVMVFPLVARLSRACQRAASFAATVRPVPLGRPARPCDPWRMHIRRRVAVLRSPPRSASVCPAGGGETCRPWHLGCSSRPRPVSASLPLPASSLPSPSRRFTSRCFVG